jgi:hypothetical protein
MSLKNKLPHVHFGKANHTPMNWEEHESDDDADDNEMDETPKDVKAMLGFDPKKVKAKVKAKVKK